MDGMLWKEVKKPVTTERVSLIVIDPKKYGFLRICVDFCKLIVRTGKDPYPVLRMEECIGSIVEATMFSTLEASSGYWQIEIVEKNRERKDFTSLRDLYQFNWMLFGLKCTSSILTGDGRNMVLRQNVYGSFRIALLCNIFYDANGPQGTC